MRKKLYRSRNDKVFAGVCGGFGQYLDVDPSIIRIVLLVLFFVGGVSLWVYVIAWILIPQRPKMLREEDLRYKQIYDEFDESDW